MEETCMDPFYEYLERFVVHPELHAGDVAQPSRQTSAGNEEEDDVYVEAVCT
jgi:hypothetical protein